MKPEKPASKTQGLWMAHDQNDSDDSAILLFGFFLVFQSYLVRIGVLDSLSHLLRFGL